MGVKAVILGIWEMTEPSRYSFRTYKVGGLTASLEGAGSLGAFLRASDPEKKVGQLWNRTYMAQNSCKSLDPLKLMAILALPCSQHYIIRLTSTYNEGSRLMVQSSLEMALCCHVPRPK